MMDSSACARERVEPCSRDEGTRKEKSDEAAGATQLFVSFVLTWNSG